MMDASQSSLDSPSATGRKRPKPGERRMQILQTIAAMLEEGTTEKVTTAALASRLSLSEAALYRHFASKAQMYEGLLDFIEDTIFSRINQIEAGALSAAAKGREIVKLLLAFSEKNPGMTRVLIGDAIVNEDARLQQRVNQLLDRVEASLRQCVRLRGLEAMSSTQSSSSASSVGSSVGSSSASPVPPAGLAMAFVEGRWLQFAKSGFKKLPSEDAEAVIPILFP